MMVKLLLSLITTFLFVPLYAQIESGSYARGFIHLKDGRVIKGDYIYTSDLEKIQIVSQQSTFVLDASEVEFISKNRPPRIKQDKTDNFDEVVVSNNRFFNLSEMGLLVGNPENRPVSSFFMKRM